MRLEREDAVTVGGGGLTAIVADQAFDGTSFLPGGVQILIQGPYILDVRPRGSGLPADCTVIEAGTALPGLIDSHVHLVAGNEPDALAQDPGRSAAERAAVIDRSLAQHLAAGVTAVRDLGDNRYAVHGRTPRPDEPLIAASGPPVTTPGGHCAALGGEAAGDDLVRAVRERAERGVDTVKVVVSGGAMTAGSDLLSLQYSPDELKVLVREAHRASLPVTAHAHSVASVRACLDAGADGIEHCTCITGRGIQTPPDLFADLAASTVPICPTFGRTPGSTPSAQALEVMRRTGMTLQARFEQVGALHRAGATILAGSDAGIHPAKPHGVLPHSVVELVNGCGIAPDAALATATSLSARACGWADVTGRLRPGLRADVLLVDGDPSRDITDITRTTSVLVAGREVISRREPPPRS